MNFGKTLAVAAFGFAVETGAQPAVRMESILPRDTDPAIDSALSAHRAALASGVALRGQLFVFLHGLGGTAAGAGQITQTAAEQGFHAVAITYGMTASPADFCAGAQGSCQENFRREILEGSDYSPYLSVSKANGVENRVVKLVRRLEALHPGENWTQFDSSGVPRWSSIVVYGHSMGAANVALWAKLHAFPRVCLSGPATDPSMWWSNPATPADRIFGFSHARDPMNAGQKQVWSALGINAFGALTDVSASSPPYGNTHTLITDVEPAPGPRPDYHNSPTMDAATPKDASGVPIYKPVWIYMLGAANPTPVFPHLRRIEGPRRASGPAYDAVGRMRPVSAFRNIPGFSAQKR